MFVGKREVKNVIVLSETTPKGGEILSVEYVDGYHEVIPKLMFEIMKSEESCDLTALRDKRVYPVAQAVLEILLEFGIKFSELHFFSTVLSSSLEQSKKTAVEKLFDRSDEEITTLDIDRVLREKKTLKDVLGNQQ